MHSRGEFDLSLFLIIKPHWDPLTSHTHSTRIRIRTHAPARPTTSTKLLRMERYTTAWCGLLNPYKYKPTNIIQKRQDGGWKVAPAPLA